MYLYRKGRYLYSKYVLNTIVIKIQFVTRLEPKQSLIVPRGDFIVLYTMWRLTNARDCVCLSRYVTENRDKTMYTLPCGTNCLNNNEYRIKIH